ncbi:MULTISPECIES: LysE family translocator [unclassified Aminobacter]|uniref:LysE family translocator n=1 Tax=unclassified Aminobacter TaxID=2644704 RepID=UPI0004649F9D|nr:MULTISPECIES: LysE family translocator [unclassified Aminobacter]TWH28710.1 threonine/homoserine/homoserine lactone efflux protein [Aminobacter sp. J15]
MSFETWAAFAVASAIMLAIPGPTILLVVSYALSHGRRVASATVAGVALGDFTAMTASMLGVGALLATSATLFTVLKWIGAAYLVYLGIKLWRAPVGDGAIPQAEKETNARRIFLHAYVVTALNPKSIIFFVAFLPQFLDPAAPALTQMVVFETTFVILATLNAAAYALLGSMARGAFRKTSVQRIVNRTGGSLLIGAGMLAVGFRKASA